MKNTIIGITLSFAVGCATAQPRSWEECKENVYHYMHSQGMCGASNCVNNGKTLGQTTVEECGYPAFTQAERAEFLEQVRRECGWDAEWMKVWCPHFVGRTIDLFPRNDPIHGQILKALGKGW